MERIHITKRLFERNIKRFQCPLCHGPMKAVAGGSLICKKGHAFDFSKRGYVNLAGRGDLAVYDKALFQARRRIFEVAIFQPLAEAITEIILRQNRKDTAGRRGVILDAGCGEGYYLKELAKNEEIVERYALCGVDLAREGVTLAAGSCEKVLWAVADLTNLPLRNQSVAVLLSILSPANYGQFNRVLDKSGIIIKVMPEADYLKEVRQAAQKYLENKAYSNEEVKHYAEKHMKVVEQERITYGRTVTPEQLKDIVNMTPMTAGLGTDEKERIRMNAGDLITIDLKVIVGRKA